MILTKTLRIFMMKQNDSYKKRVYWYSKQVKYLTLILPTSWSVLRSVSKGELRVLKVPLLIFWGLKIGKILGENRGKIGEIFEKREKRIFSTPLSNVLDTPLVLTTGTQPQNNVVTTFVLSLSCCCNVHTTSIQRRSNVMY